MDRSVAVRRLGAASLFLVPLLHPVGMPYVGMPSHLLWWLHVLPVALFTFQGGRRPGAISLLVSTLLVAAGESVLGGGFWLPAPRETVVALTVALFGTNLLVFAFAIYARDVTTRYRLLFERVGVGVLQTDGEGCIRFVNPAALDFFGLGDPSPLLGKPVIGVLRPDGVSSLSSLEREGWSGELEYWTHHGPRSRHALLMAAGDPETGGYQVLLADRSTEAMQELEIDRQAKLASLGEALAGVAHELKNPLTTIVAHAQLGLIDHPEDSDTRDAFRVISHDAFRMRDLVDELLGFSRRSEEGLCADLAEVVGRVARVQRIALGRRIEILEDLRWTGAVRASPVKIEQILLNLISNAAYSVQHSGGTRITISARGEGDSVLVEVRDDGAGIDPDIADRLFDPFQTTKPPGDGTGLGLAISRRLARGWGGDLTANNLQPRGAAFALRLRVPDRDSGDCGQTTAHQRLIA